MKSSLTKITIIAITVIFVGFAVIFPLSSFLENSRPPLPEDYADQDLALQGANLKGYALGFEGLIADWYWMQSLQYLGNKLINTKGDLSLDNLQSLNPRLLYPYLDNAATLDPQFLSVYEFGAIVLPAVNVEQAIKIAEKGIENNPGEWRLYQHLGYIYWRKGDYQNAAETYGKGAQIAGAPPFMKMMAARMKSEGGSRETARAVYQQMLEEATDEQIREMAALRLLQLDSLDEQEAIRPILKDFQEKNGRCVNDWREIFPLMQKLRLPTGSNLRFDSKTFSPLDPSNTPYLLKKESGKCDIQINFAESKIPAR
ncbi:MAG TPA: hypothetical protein VK892_08860 [Pyrinomonadaceae bacterium]|nr:hypothetical protein [Pyrinomonadaceae bacterium]